MDLFTLHQWETAFEGIISGEQGLLLRDAMVRPSIHLMIKYLLTFPLTGQAFMIQISQIGYRGSFSALMLSAYKEWAASQGTLSCFNWSRVSESDPRIAGSPWLRRTNGKQLSELCF
jgi:Ni,Fe-hydrogenase I cytochrome b subunit